jgi:hypothetical protein
MEKASLHLYALLGLQDGSACGAHFLSALVRPTCVIARNGSSTRTTTSACRVISILPACRRDSVGGHFTTPAKGGRRRHSGLEQGFSGT